jgi:hypothetical protein
MLKSLFIILLLCASLPAVGQYYLTDEVAASVTAALTAIWFFLRDK